jgi:hypothetical protein
MQRWSVCPLIKVYQGASETTLELVVLENQQQPETLNQMASETCTKMIIHLDFKPDSPLQ